jgi:outer membrane protein insertion porin family
VEGSQRLEPETILSYTKLRVGGSYTRETLDAALRDLYETELFADVQIRDNAGVLTVTVKENPVINRIVLEGNKRLKEDKIRPEIKMAPREIYHPLQGARRCRPHYRAVPPPGPLCRHRRAEDGEAGAEPRRYRVRNQRRAEIQGPPDQHHRQQQVFPTASCAAKWRPSRRALPASFSSGTSYDPDRMAYDQQKMRQFYLTQGYADFRVVSAVAELTPDKQDFIITYVVEEGQRYKFGDVRRWRATLRDLSGERLTSMLPMQEGRLV